MKPPDNEFGERVLGLLDRKARILEVFAIDVIAFLDKKDLLKEFVEERINMHSERPARGKACGGKRANRIWILPYMSKIKSGKAAGSFKRRDKDVL